MFYIDHVNRQTTWQKPQSGQRSIHRRPTISSEQRQQMDRRYQSIRRTIRQRTDLEPASNSAESSSSGWLLTITLASDCILSLFTDILLDSMYEIYVMLRKLQIAAFPASLILQAKYSLYNVQQITHTT